LFSPLLLQSGESWCAYFQQGRDFALSSPERQGVAPDLAAVVAMKAGDQGALAELYDRYSSVVYAVALRVLGDAGAAEDVLQEVFLQLWRNPAGFDAARGSLGAWLAVISRNRAIDFLRRRRPDTDIEDVVLSVAPDLAAEADRSRAAEKIRGVLGTMPVPQRSALEMAYFEGMSHSEIASKTGEPLGTIKTRIRAGLMALRKAFQT
jgi:RNA polymerase sigma-70 factor, ECF subfamily